MVSTIAKNVKRIMAEKGLKQGATGERAGYNIKTFNNMLNGRKIITDVDILALCSVLDVTPNELLGFENPKSA